MAFNDFGVLGPKTKAVVEQNGKFNKLEEFEKFLGTSATATARIIHQIFLVPDEVGAYMFEVNCVGVNVTDGTVLVAARGVITATVTALGAVTISTDANNGLVDHLSADAVTNVTVTKQDASATRPAAININAVGVDAKATLFSGTVQTLAYATRYTVIPLTQGVSPTAPALT